MDSRLVGEVRRFNRTVTQRIGALNDAFLARGRPLGQARVLWEIGPGGSDVRALRSRLDLDSGYLSRLLRSLEQDGLVAVERSGSDGRVRTARLTPRGLAERAVLDRRSDDAAVATHIRFSSAGAPSWNFSAPHPTGSPCRVATSSRPAGGVSSASSAEMLRSGSKPPSNRSASSVK